MRRLLERYGPPSTAFALPQPGLSVWEGPEGEVAYTEAAGFWIGVAGPVGPPEARARLVEQFRAAAREAGRQACFFGSPEELPGWEAVPIGLEAFWAPGRGGRGSVRELLRRASRKGVLVAEEAPSDQLQELVYEWRRRQAMPPMGFLLATEPLAERPGRRIWVARQGGRAIGFAVAVPLGQESWLIEFLVLARPVPQGTAESLIDAVMRSVPEARTVSLGLTALAAGPLKAVADRLNWLYSFRGIYHFRARLRPDWRPLHVLCPPGRRLRAFYAVLSAFANRKPQRFAVGTLRRLLARPALVREPQAWALGADVLALGLIPWTLMLWLCDSQRWFGCDWLARAWASFDALVLGLFLLLGTGLRRRRRTWVRPLAFALFGAVLADVWMTGAQAVLYNIPHARSAWDWIGIAVGLSGPPLAALYLGLLLLRAPLRRS